MMHYVLLKLKPGADAQYAFKRVRETFEALDETLEFFNHPVTYSSCVERDSNADIMSVVELDGPEFLQSYLQHPLHVAMANDLNDMVAVRVSFDHM